MANYFETYEILGDALEDLQDWESYEADMAESDPWAE